MIEYMVHYCGHGIWNMELRDTKYPYPVWKASRVTFSNSEDIDEIICIVIKNFRPKSVEVIDKENFRFYC